MADGDCDLETGVLPPEERRPSRSKRWRPAGVAWDLASKLGGALLSLGLVLVLGFFLFRILPGDPVAALTRNNPGAAPEHLDALRTSFGLDKPLLAQFVDYLKSTMSGDLGVSFKYRRPVSEIILARLWPTMLLVGTATLASTVLGLWVGARSGWRRGSAFDKGSTAVALALWSMPMFWVGMVVLMVFAVGVGPIPGLFPAAGMRSTASQPGFFTAALDILWHLMLPCMTLVAAYYAQYALVMRSSLLDELGNTYLTIARAKGLRDDLVRRRHAVPNALLPTVTLIFMELGFVVSGTITVETVYSWPGLGWLAYDALSTPDLPLLQGTFLVFSGAVIVMNAFAEVVQRLLDPRVRAP